MSLKGDDLFPPSREEELEILKSILKNAKMITDKDMVSGDWKVVDFELHKTSKKIDELLKQM